MLINKALDLRPHFPGLPFIQIAFQCLVASYSFCPLAFALLPFLLPYFLEDSFVPIPRSAVRSSQSNLIQLVTNSAISGISVWLRRRVPWHWEGTADWRGPPQVAKRDCTPSKAACTSNSFLFLFLDLDVLHLSALVT